MKKQIEEILKEPIHKHSSGEELGRIERIKIRRLEQIVLMLAEQIDKLTVGRDIYRCSLLEAISDIDNIKYELDNQ